MKSFVYALPTTSFFFLLQGQDQFFQKKLQKCRLSELTAQHSGDLKCVKYFYGWRRQFCLCNREYTLCDRKTQTNSTASHIEDKKTTFPRGETSAFISQTPSVASICINSKGPILYTIYMPYPLAILSPLPFPQVPRLSLASQLTGWLAWLYLLRVVLCRNVSGFFSILLSCIFLPRAP